MMETRIRNDARTKAGTFAAAFDKRPGDFEHTFIRIGRVACEGHYHVGRATIDAWLEECGKAPLIELRASFVRQRQAEQRQNQRINRRDMGKILSEAFREPVDDRPVPLPLAREAAQFLRIRRNGGFAVSQAPNGDWCVGLKRMSARQMVTMARGKGFRPAVTRWS